MFRYCTFTDSDVKVLSPTEGKIRTRVELHGLAVSFYPRGPLCRRKRGCKKAKLAAPSNLYSLFPKLFTVPSTNLYFFRGAAALSLLW